MRISASYPGIRNGLTLYAVGDVHGRLDLLQQLHAAIDAHSANSGNQGVEIYLGDYVDRGPHSAGTLACLMARARSRAVVALRGNHEASFEKFVAGDLDPATWRSFGGYETLLSYGVDLRRLEGAPRQRWVEAARAAIPDEHLAFLAGMRDGFPFDGYFFCHAGIRPGVPLAQQSSTDLLWIRDEFLTDQRDHGVVVVHGHTPREAPEFCFNRINIDTGAYMTGRLTCLVIDQAGPRLLEHARVGYHPA